ncbi:MAG: hypothetical protein JWQ47_289 [Glaciihabitans sp.]|jgi:hypothetical protein|nr:hypothetical protein [Glaciihabitans sp.]
MGDLVLEVIEWFGKAWDLGRAEKAARRAGDHEQARILRAGKIARYILGAGIVVILAGIVVLWYYLSTVVFG